jgi:hypothetical protein
MAACSSNRCKSKKNKKRTSDDEEEEDDRMKNVTKRQKKKSADVKTIDEALAIIEEDEPSSAESVY